MQIRAVFTGLMLIGLLLLSFCGERDKPVPLKDRYLGMTPPCMEPEVFAPGIVSSDNQEHGAPAISPDGKEIYWSLWPLPYAPEKPQVIKFVRYGNGIWSEPEVAPFSGKYSDGSPCFSPDGEKLYFCSKRQLNKDGKLKTDADIWVVEKNDEGWQEPEHLGFTVNSDRFVYSLSVAQNGNLYFCAGYQVNGISDVATKVDESLSQGVAKVTAEVKGGSEQVKGEVTNLAKEAEKKISATVEKGTAYLTGVTGSVSSSVQEGVKRLKERKG